MRLWADHISESPKRDQDRAGESRESSVSQAHQVRSETKLVWGLEETLRCGDWLTGVPGFFSATVSSKRPRDAERQRRASLRRGFGSGRERLSTTCAEKREKRQWRGDDSARNVDAPACTFLALAVLQTHLSFGPEYEKAVEAKQVAQQQAERGKYIVLRALEEKKSTIIKAQGEAEAAKLIGNAIKNNPAFLELRRIDTAKEVANTISKSSNRVMLNSDSLLLNLMGKDFKTGVSELTGGK
ncbi:SPFH domain / Band 7 family protein [Toxoplasma gondii MAS]|uniref:Prohibitin n=1 Tax=Toxoplasma gondii MAS TaxID=943118 RepID=A0A086QXC8_TOXGO|nr:SPFH domain / Band 7 family protein [Toxoplasma gondii MAS]